MHQVALHAQQKVLETQDYSAEQGIHGHGQLHMHEHVRIRQWAYSLEAWH